MMMYRADNMMLYNVYNGDGGDNNDNNDDGRLNAVT